MNTDISPLAVWHGGQVSQAERQKILNQQPITIWMTGLSAGGKSTLAFALERELIDQGHACYVLDGDTVRLGLSRNLGFSPEGRAENIRRIAEVARLMNDAGLIVIAALISPYRVDRAAASEIVGSDSFREVYISTPLSVCESRDPKGLYTGARAGKVANFTGISSPYEAPELPDLVIDTSQLPLDQTIAQLIALAVRLPPVL